MKLLQNIAAASCLIFLSGMNASAQETIKVDDPWKDYPSKKALYNDYSRWSICLLYTSPSPRDTR